MSRPGNFSSVYLSLTAASSFGVMAEMRRENHLNLFDFKVILKQIRPIDLHMLMIFSWFLYFCSYFLCQYHFPSTMSWTVPQEPCQEQYLQIRKMNLRCIVIPSILIRSLSLACSPVKSVSGHALPTDGDRWIFQRRNGKSSGLAELTQQIELQILNIEY